MKKLLRLDIDKSIVFEDHIESFLNPNYIYIPLTKGYDLLVGQNSYIYKGQVLLEKKLNKVISPISGKLIGTTCIDEINKKVGYLVIENDFKEKEKKYRQSMEAINTKEAILTRLYNFGFNEVATLFENNKLNNLVINVIHDEPYIMNNQYILNKYAKNILEAVDILSKNFCISKTIIVIKNTATKNINKCLSLVGTYPNIDIKLVDDKYLIGKKEFLLNALSLDAQNSVLITPELALDIYYVLKYNKFNYSTFVTIAGNGVNKSKVLEVKEGTSLKELLDKKVMINTLDYKVIINGVMRGYEGNINTIITKNIAGILIVINDEKKETECINCGLCNKACPIGIDVKKVIMSKKIIKCLDCGLCCYICPSYINLRKYLKGEDE